MKLLLCPVCQDVVKLTQTGRYCQCGQSWGRYLDDVAAEISGQGIPLGFANSSLVSALQRRPDEGLGATFTAFVIARYCETVACVEHVAPDTNVGPPP